MSASRRRAVLLALGMSSTAVLAAWLKPSALPAAARIDLDRLLPAQFGDWKLDPAAAAFVRAADRRGAQVRIYDQVFERTFINPRGDRIMLSVAYGGDQSADMQLHRPEVCYRAGGFEVGSSSGASLRLPERELPVTRLTARLPGRPEPITYWAVVGGRLDVGERLSLLQRVTRTARPQRGDGLLVRVSSIDQDAEHAYRLHAEFAAAMLKALPAAERARLTGADSHP
ncbi:MAG: EpsI family protein [Piscinibacter sp.]|nr:EpsI family protein [Piscinibacter sp.]